MHKESKELLKMSAKIEEQKSKAVRTLGTMFEYLGLNAELKVEEKNSKIAIKILSEDAGRIIGRKGQSLESLQMLLNRMLFNKDTEFPRVILDIDGYAGFRNDSFDKTEEKRASGYSRSPNPHEESEEYPGNDENDDILRQQALDAAKEVKRWGDPVTLSRMNARDRRIIHITLQDDSEITTESVGEGSLKKVVISAKK